MAIIAGKQPLASFNATRNLLGECVESGDYSPLTEGDQTPADIRAKLLGCEREAEKLGLGQFSLVRDQVNKAFEALKIARDPGLGIERKA